MSKNFIFSFFIIFFAVSLQAKAELPNLCDLVCGRLKLSSTPAEVWQLQAMKESRQRDWRQSETGYEKAQLLALQWFHQHFQNVRQNQPVHPHFNKAFGIFLRDSLRFENGSTEENPLLDTAVFAVADLVMLGNENKSTWMEMLGDLLLMKKGNDFCYLAAAAYQQAAQTTTDEMTRVTWERKAIFAMEKRIINPAFFDKPRETRFLTALREEASRGNIEVNFPVFMHNFQYWPSEKTAYPAFVENQLKLDRSEERKLVPSRDITLPGVDPKAVKRNFTYNVYAIFILLALFTSVGLLFRRFKKAAQQQQEVDSKE